MNVTILIGTYSHEGVKITQVSVCHCNLMMLSVKYSYLSQFYAIPLNDLSLQGVVFNKAFQVDHPKILAASQGSIKYAFITVCVCGL